jgi:hypothetical protein
MSESSETKGFLRVGDRLWFPSGVSAGVVGGLVSSASRAKIYAIGVARAFPPRPRTATATGTEAGAVLDGPLHAIPSGNVGCYRSIMEALALSTITSDQLLELDTNSSWAGGQEIRLPDEAFHSEVVIGFRGARQVPGFVAALGAVVTLQANGERPVGYHGGLRITALSGRGFVDSGDAGSPVFAGDGALLGFLVAARGEDAYVAPAQPLFDALSVFAVGRATIAQHNRTAELIIENRARHASASDTRYSKVTTFSETIPPWFYRTAPAARVA